MTFAVGVDPDRLGWAIETARSARQAAGLDPSAFGLGTYVPMFVHDDRDVAREMLRRSIGSHARFSVMHGTVAGPVAESQRDSLEAVHKAYDMNAHFKHGSPQSQELTAEVIDAFSIAGRPSYCLERIAELREMGITRFFVQGPGRGAAEDKVAASHKRLVEEVLPEALA